MNKKCIISTSDIPPKIEYIGLWNMLDELLKKVKETDDTDKIKLYCDIYFVTGRLHFNNICWRDRMVGE